MCFIPCCKAKRFQVRATEPVWITPHRLHDAWPRLEEGRACMGQPKDRNQQFRAGSTYHEKMFLSAPSLLKAPCVTTIISAGYGLVGLDDPICEYDEEMKG